MKGLQAIVEQDVHAAYSCCTLCCAAWLCITDDNVLLVPTGICSAVTNPLLCQNKSVICVRFLTTFSMAPDNSAWESHTRIQPVT